MTKAERLWKWTTDRSVPLRVLFLRRLLVAFGPMVAWFSLLYLIVLIYAIA